MVAKKNFKKRPAAKRRAWKGRKPHISRSLNDQKQYSSIVESVSYDASILANVPTNWTIGLGNLTRARLMARCFQFFRIDEVSYKYTLVIICSVNRQLLVILFRMLIVLWTVVMNLLPVKSMLK